MVVHQYPRGRAALSDRLLLRARAVFILAYPTTLAAIVDQLCLLLTYAGVAQAVFVTLLLNNRRVRKSRANGFLSVLLLAMAFSVLHSLYAGQTLAHFSIKAYPLGDPTFLVIAPLLWLYVQELTGHRVRLSAQTALHFAPSVVLSAGSLLLGHVSNDFGENRLTGNNLHWTYLLFWALVVVQFLGYRYVVNKRWLEYQQLLEEEVSNTEQVNIGWIRFFMRVFLGITVFFLLVLINLIHHGDMSGINRLSAVVLAGSIFALGYKGILQNDVFHVPLPAPNGHNDAADSLPAAEPKQPDQLLIDRLLRYMESEKPYLDPELTLSSLANQLGVSRSALSQLINEGVGDNFYNFVNKYRVEQVKRCMVDPALAHFSLLGLALEAGFKSKSTFNLIFKRFTGLTPSEYMQTVR
ncbi:helix-turn-helix transcriptional regulator [Fibrella sp. HMF5335]|uniref:Helix-turn-helix transcriptional regulator n=1 Tax=Fibrella rubiginis TaxID=2817060 RepID=A0A939GC77_9BACT|nr:AraC family transcriptional regulator [Fibrella rubiginis]MBO0935113.1 helix-turn-helix transcriptional regulator [Fibrella rubiginis]